MGWCQHKNSSNNLKYSITTTKSSKNTSGTLEHSIPEGIEVIDCTHNIMKVIESIKQDEKKLTEMDERITKSVTK